MNERQRVEQLENMRLSMQRQMEQEQVQAFKPLLKNYKGPVKVQSPTTEEMVKEYEKEKNKPIEIDGKLYRNNPLLDELDLEEYEPAYKPEDFEDSKTIEGYKERINDIKNELIDYNLNIEENIKNTESKIQELNKKLNSKRIKHGTRMSYTIALDKEEDKLERLKEQLRDDNPAKEEFFNQIKELNDRVNENEEKAQKNREIKQEVDKINSERRRARIETIKMLNIGKFSLGQSPSETDEQYLKRLEDVANQEVSADVIEKEAEIDNMQTLKKNLKDIIRNESRIENIVRSFDKDDLFILNTNWPKIRKQYIENYGTNNKNLNAPEIVAILVTILEDIKKKGLTSVLSKVKSENLSTEDIKDIATGSAPIDDDDEEKGLDTFNDIDIEYDDFIKALHINNGPGKDIYIKIINKGIGSKLHKYISVSYDADAGGNGKYILIRPTRGGAKLKEYANHLDIDLERLRKNLGIPKKYFLTFDAIPYIERKFPKLSNPPLGNAKTIDDANKVWGYGLQKLPNECQFGNININLDKLYHKNILSVTSNKGYKLMGFQNTRVSDAFVALIMKYCKKEHVLPKDINNLNLSEKELYDHLVHLAKLSKDVASSSDQTIEKLKNRFQLIDGQIQAGNNNPELLHELYQLLQKMVNFNLISASEFKRYFKQVEKKF
jgi:hypothetical protein